MEDELSFGYCDRDLKERALTAWFRRCAKEGWVPSQPRSYVDTVEYRGRTYVPLEGGGGDGLLCVFRVLPNGHLKFLRRPPAAVADAVRRWR
jgi:hypothetical protein